MKYRLLASKLTPEVVYFLDAIPAGKSRHEELKLRHPADNFVLVFGSVIESGIQLCRDQVTAMSLEEASKEAIDFDARLRLSIIAFYESLAKYIDGCRTIIRCLTSDKDLTKKGREFSAAIEDYKKHVGTVANFIKHQQRDVRPVHAEWPDGRIVGFFVEGVVGDGEIGCEPEVHKYPGTAFSLNRMMKYHACHIYLVASALQSTLNLHGDKSDKTLAKLEGSIAEFLRLICDIPMLFFPDEHHEIVPLVKRVASGGEGFLLEYPSRVKASNRALHVMNMHLRIDVGLHAHKFSVPYMVPGGPWVKRVKQK